MVMRKNRSKILVFTHEIIRYLLGNWGFWVEDRPPFLLNEELNHHSQLKCTSGDQESPWECRDKGIEGVFASYGKFSWKLLLEQTDEDHSLPEGNR